MHSLTAKQARFAAEFVVDGNATAAAIRAGFNPNSARVTACKLLKANSAVQAAVDTHRAALAARMEVDRQKVLAGLLEAIEMARAQTNPMGMIQGYASIAKLLGYYAPARVRVGVDTGTAEEAITRRLNSYTDAELLKMIEADGETV